MTDPPAPAPNPAKGERIAKVIAHAGLCSRRTAEQWIAEGRVAVNGKTLDSPAVTVTEADRIAVDDRPLPVPPEAKLWRYHKPPGLLTTHRDPEGRPTLFDRLPAELGWVISVGRLDFTSEGLLLLTNNGDLSRHLELPATGWARRYRVRVYGLVDEPALERLEQGVTVDGVRYAPITARLDSGKGPNSWLTLTLREGKNREVRKVLEHLGLTVNRLIRTSYGPFQLGTLKRGEVAQVPRKVLREQLGKGALR
jgi:23S rRNA pseudouridine2605 synthase